MCGWEDDPDSWEHPSEKSGPNWRSLYKHQKKIIRHGFPYYWKKFREEEGKPSDYETNKDWEPFEADYEHLREVKKEYRQFVWMFGSYAYKEYEESKKKKKE